MYIRNIKDGIFMFKYMQRMGKSLMTPVAVLPAAAVLLGVGYWIDPASWGGNSAIAAFLVTAGNTILSNMAILFAIGLAYGMSKDQNGAAALSGLVAFLIITTLLSPGTVENLRGITLTDGQRLAFDKINNPFIGILSGLVAAETYNRFHKIELPAFLAFFSGKRSVPIITAAAMCVLACAFMFVWPVVFGGLLGFGKGISELDIVGVGLYGFFNRLLIPTGLHHALNSVFWFDFVGINDLGKFWSPDGIGVVGETGRYMAGFFPVMMFGLPGACLAMYKAAKESQKKTVYGLMMAAGFAAFFTGVTEPVEFSFMFAAPLLFLVHAVLTSISMMIAASMQWLAGFAFSAGLIDMTLSSHVVYATNWYMLIVLGIVYFFVYYFTFSFLIKKFNLKTPGREDISCEEETHSAVSVNNWTDMANSFICALGGKDNITEVDNCATRLRLSVNDSAVIDDGKLKRSGALGVIKPGKTEVQVVVGPKVQFVTDEIKRLILS